MQPGRGVRAGRRRPAGVAGVSPGSSDDGTSPGAAVSLKAAKTSAAAEGVGITVEPEGGSDEPNLETAVVFAFDA